MSGRLRFEAWTLPTAGTFEKITDIPALAGSTGTRELSAYTDGSLQVAADWDGLDLIISTTVGSLIRVYDGTTLVDEFLAERLDVPVDRPSAVTISGTQINGIVEKLAVYPYNYPNDISTSQDWVWGGPSILPSLALADLANVREVWELWHDGTGGTFTLTVDGQTTASIDYTIVSPLVIENRLQDLSTVTDVTVSGDGSTEDTPWVITFYNPPNPGTFTITDSLTGGTATLTQITAGALDPSPITQSQRADARVDPDYHGTYDSPPIQVVETLLNTGSDWALLVNTTGQFAGSQIILNVKPGHTYSNISVPVRPDSNGSYRLIIRDIYENLVAGPDVWETALTAGSYQTLTVPQFTVPDGVYQIIMRVAVVQPTYADFRVDWQHATINEGDAEATPGEIVRILIENAQTERSAFAFLDIAGFSDTADTDSTSWGSSISFTASFGQHMGHVLDGLAGLGYEWQITPKGTPSGGFTHDLDLYVPDGAGTDHTSSQGGPAVMSNTVAAANVVKRIPAYTAGLAWGNETYLEDTDATRLTNFGRWEKVFDSPHLSSTASLQELLDEQFAEQATNLTATQATIRDDTTTPLVDYDVGDTIWWQFPGTLTKEARRIKRVSWAHDDLATYTLHASTVHTGDSAMAAAVNRLLNKYNRRDRGTDAVAPFTVPSSGIRPYLIIAASDSPYRDHADLVCDGTNDQIQFNQAVSSLGSSGGHIHFMAGTYEWGAAPATVDDLHLTVSGEGRATVINANGYNGFVVTGVSHCTFRDFNLNGTNSGTVTGLYFQEVSSAALLVIDNLHIDGFANNVLDSRSSSEAAVVISNSRLITTQTYNVYTSGESGLLATNNYFKSTGTYNIYLGGATVLDGNMFTGVTSNHAVYSDNTLGLTRGVISNNIFHSVGDCFRTHGDSLPIVITGNTFSSFVSALRIPNSASGGVTITGNSFYNGTSTLYLGAASPSSNWEWEANRQYNVTSPVTGVGHTHTGAGLALVADDLTDVDTTTTAPVNGDLLMFNGTNWVPQTTPFFGQIYLTTPTATTIASSGVFYKMLGTTTLVSGGNGFDMPANNRLRYTGTPTRTFMISVTGGATTANNNVTLQYRLAKNGTTVAATQIIWLKKTGTDQRTFPINHIVELATNDYIELFVNNTTGTGNVTLQHMNMIANGIL